MALFCNIFWWNSEYYPSRHRSSYMKEISMISHLYPEKLASEVHFLMPGNSICHLLTPISQDTDVLSSYFLFIQLDLCLERLYSKFHPNWLENKGTGPFCLKGILKLLMQKLLLHLCCGTDIFPSICPMRTKCWAMAIK